MKNTGEKSQSSVSTLSEPEVVEHRLQAWLAEYQALRSEIEWLIRDGTQYQKFAVALLGIVFAAIGLITQSVKVLLLPTLLVTPFLFCLLGFLFIRQHEEAYIIGAYIKEYVRPKVRKLLSENDLWGWEEFKHQTNENLCEGRMFKLFSSIKMIFILRSFIFILPSAVCLTSVCIYSTLRGMPFLLETYKFPLLVLFIAVYFLDIAVFLLFSFYLFTQTNLSKRVGICKE